MYVVVLADFVSRVHANCSVIKRRWQEVERVHWIVPFIIRTCLIQIVVDGRQIIHVDAVEFYCLIGDYKPLQSVFPPLFRLLHCEIRIEHRST